MSDPILTYSFDGKLVAGHPIASMADVGKSYPLVPIESSLDFCKQVLATFEFGE
jgi:hypothetical protein